MKFNYLLALCTADQKVKGLCMIKGKGENWKVAPFLFEKKQVRVVKKKKKKKRPGEREREQEKKNSKN